MKKINIPKIGARNIKTALSVFLSIIVIKILGFESPFYACIASVICLSDSYETSIKMGINRMIGTIIGGLFGLLATVILSKYDNFLFKSILIFLFTIIVIYLCTLLKKPGSVTIACIVLLANLLLDRNYSNYTYTISRIIETFIGIIIAVLVNRLILPHKKAK